MSRFITLCLLVLIALSTFKSLAQTVYKDYLIYPVSQKAKVNVEGKDLILNNGLVKRVFRLSPNVACTDYTNLINGQQLLRSVEPEARIIIDGKQYEVGGLRGQKEKAYLLPEWVDKMLIGQEDFIYSTYTVSDLTPFINWKCTTWAMNKKQATGKRVIFEYISPLKSLSGIIVKVMYELYDGIPLIVKSVGVDRLPHLN